jgi:hypothetical protein
MHWVGRFGGFTARDIMSSENLDTAHAIFSAWSDLYRINLIKRESRVTGDIAFGRVADIKTGCPKFTRTAGAVGDCEHVDCLVGLKFRYQLCFSFYPVSHSYKLSYTSTVIRLYVLSCSIQCIALKADSHPVSYLRKAKSRSPPILTLLATPQFPSHLYLSLLLAPQYINNRVATSLTSTSLQHPLLLLVASLQHCQIIQIMAQPPTGIPADLRPRWIAMHQVHEQRIQDFKDKVQADRITLTRKIERDMAEFDKRVELAKESLLARNFREEAQLWNGNHAAQASGASRAATAAPTGSARMPPPVARATATPARRPETPKGRQPPKAPATPVRPAETPRVPPAPKKAAPRPNPSRNNGAPEVIDLCDSDEDKQRPAQKKPVAPRKPVVQQPVTSAPPVQNPTVEDADDCMEVDEASEAVQTGAPATFMPEATISLFGSKQSSVNPPATIRMDDYSHIVQFSSGRWGPKQDRFATPRPSSPFTASPVKQSEKEYHGLPAAVPTSSLLRASTAAPRSGARTESSPFMSPSPAASSQGRWSGNGLSTPSSARPTFGTTRRADSAVPPLSGSTLKSRPLGAQFPPSASQPLVPDKRPELPLNSLRQQQQDRSAILKEATSLPRNEALFNLEQQKQNGSFVNNVLRNERSQSLAPELGNVLAGKAARAGDVEMEDVLSLTTPDESQG